MNYKVTIKNEGGAGIPGASLKITSPEYGGSVVLQAGGDGVVNVDTSMPAIDTDNLTGVILTGSADGFEELTITPASLNPNIDIILTKKTSLLPILLVGAGIAVAAMTATGKRKKKVSGFNDLPPMAKNGIVLGGVALIAYLILTNKEGNQGLANAAADELVTLSHQGVLPTLSSGEVETLASELRTAFDDCGTNTDVVMSSFAQLSNKADLYFLIQLYGTRSYKGCFDGDYFSEHAYNLAQALTSELSASEMAQLNGMLANKGIDYKF